MSYYRGDYYRGDYYRGDPGFLSFLGGAAKAIGGFIPGVGPLISAGGEAISKVAASRAAKTAIVKAAPSVVSSTLAKLKGGVLKHPVLTGAGAAGLAGAAAGIAGRKLLSQPWGRRKGRRSTPAATKAILQ